MTYIKHIVLLLGIYSFSQETTSFLIISSNSFTSNYLEYNTGEIFVELIHQENKEIESLNEYKIYPNPVNDIFKISTNEVIAKIEIFTIDGKLLLEKLEPQNSVNIEYFAKGIYILVINKNITFKLLKL